MSAFDEEKARRVAELQECVESARLASREESVGSVDEVSTDADDNASKSEEGDAAAGAKRDKSRAGSADVAIVPLLEAINDTDDFYTTSSCAGRVIVVEQPPGKGYTTNWLFVTHETDYFPTGGIPEGALKSSGLSDGIWASLAERQGAENPSEAEGWEVWMKMEPCLVSIKSRTVADARKLLGVARQAGFKRAYITAVCKDGTCIIHVADTQRLELPLAVDGTVIVQPEYVAATSTLANRKLHITRERIDKLCQTVKEKL